MRTTLLSAFVAFATLAGCATGGRRLPRRRGCSHLGRKPFELSARGSRITGQVCGMDLDVDVRRSSDGGVALNGTSTAGFRCT